MRKKRKNIIFVIFSIFLSFCLLSSTVEASSKTKISKKETQKIHNAVKLLEKEKVSLKKQSIKTNTNLTNVITKLDYYISSIKKNNDSSDQDMKEILESLIESKEAFVYAKKVNGAPIKDVITSINSLKKNYKKKQYSSSMKLVSTIRKDMKEYKSYYTEINESINEVKSVFKELDAIL